MLTIEQIEALDPACVDADTLAELVRVYRLVLQAPTLDGDTSLYSGVYDALGYDYGDGPARLVIP